MAPSASGDISIIWGYQGYGISQEYGRTAFSMANSSWYAYGAQFGMDGVSHPGLDVSMGRGTWLYSPVNGTVVVSGNSSGFTFYGNGNAQVGELRIRSDAGHEVVLGHMGRIAVGVGQYVTVGQFVGVSGGYNGDHLHLETRQSNGTWLQAVDPRGSFLVTSIVQAATDQSAETTETAAEESPATPIPTAPPREALSPEQVAREIGGNWGGQYASAATEPAPAPDDSTAEPSHQEPDGFGPNSSRQPAIHDQAVIQSSRFRTRNTGQSAVAPGRLLP